jgi:hypothetical protein
VQSASSARFASSVIVTSSGQDVLALNICVNRASDHLVGAKRLVLVQLVLSRTPDHVIVQQANLASVRSVPRALS